MTFNCGGAATITVTSTKTTAADTTIDGDGGVGGSGLITVNELITLVNIDLGTADASACPHGIPSGAEVDIALIIQAVNNALANCPAS